MRNLPRIVTSTALIPHWFMKDQVDEVVNSIISGGVKALQDYSEEHLIENNLDIDVGVDINLSHVDWQIAYLIIRDWKAEGLWRNMMEGVVCDYMGLTYADLDEKSQPSAANKVKRFGVKSLAEVSKVTNIPLRTLNDWFDTKKIAFHCALEFTAKLTTENGIHDV